MSTTFTCTGRKRQSWLRPGRETGRSGSLGAPAQRRLEPRARNGNDNLAKPIPVLIIYGTVAVDDKSTVFFFDDTYGYDKLLDEALKKGYPYPTA